MRTIKATGQLLYKVKTPKTKGVPEGHVHVMVVSYQTFEMTAAQFTESKFQIHDANSEEAKVISALVALP